MPDFSLHQRIRSFLHALRGIRWLVSTQFHAKIHALATLGVLACGFGLEIDRTDWALLTVAIAIVWIAEAFNTALEFLADEVSLDHRERIGKAKDIAAGAVLISALAAVVIGGFIFAPYVIHGR